MTKKDYKQIAEALRLTKPTWLNSECNMERARQWSTDVVFVCDVLAEDNRRFDRHKFLEACSWYTNAQRIADAERANEQ